MQILIGRLNRSRPIMDFNVCCSSGDPDDYDAECGSSSRFLLFAQKAKEKNAKGLFSGNTLLCATNPTLTIKYFEFYSSEGLE